MNTQKGFVSILLILLGIVVIGGGVYFYLPKVKETNVNKESVEVPLVENSDIPTESKIPTRVTKNDNSIQTYTNNQFNFSASISSDIKVTELNDGTNKMVTFKDDNEFIVVRLVKMGVYGNSLDTWNYIQINKLPKTEMLIDNKKAFVHSVPSYGDGGESFPAQVIATVENNGYVYQFEFQNSTKLSEKEKDFLSNVKFLINDSQKTGSSNEIIDLDWKTYTNSQYGFTIKYPENWNIEEGTWNGVGKNHFIFRTNDVRAGVLGDFWVGIIVDVTKPYTLAEGAITSGVKIAGLDAIKVEYKESSSQSGPGTDYYLDRNGISYRLQISYNNPRDYVGDNILKTFTFTK